jgi:hypothetical protein
MKKPQAATPLNERETFCWRQIAMHVATHNAFPTLEALGLVLGCSPSTSATYRQRLVAKGYLGRSGGGRGLGTTWRILIWPDGIPPRDFCGPVESIADRHVPLSRHMRETILRLRVKDGLLLREIVKKTGVTMYRVKRALGLKSSGEKKPHTPALTKPRRCLMCSHEFVSEGVGNRICAPCKGSRTWQGGADFPCAGPVTTGRGVRV